MPARLPITDQFSGILLFRLFLPLKKKEKKKFATFPFLR